MLKKVAATLLLALAVYWGYVSLKPSNTISTSENSSSFSTEKALEHLKIISEKPHYVGTPEHEKVKEYIAGELQKLGFEVSYQEAYSVTEDWGSFTKPENIIAKYPGTEKGKALLLLSHYDSNPFSSYGASDDGSGVVTILEGLRAFLSENKPKNDLLVVISDAEELGLNGADIFVNKNPLAKNVGLVLNFEARGSGGPSYMLVETNGGNKTLIKEFIKANPQFPVGNSLAYSIYKMLPNDTDLTRFREDANIDGFNFAFIDDHFDYHTALDTYPRLDVSSLKHQASYLMPLLTYFSQADLSNLKSEEDLVYFNTPVFKMVSYPFSWAIPMLILAVVLFILLVYYGIQKQTFKFANILKGFGAFTVILIINGLIGYFAWSVLNAIYPNYAEILQGFPYNGHLYIWAFTFLSITVCTAVYHRFYKPENAGSLLIAPMFYWLVLCAIVTFKLRGASFFIIPVYFALVSLFVLARQKKPNMFLLVLLCVPVLTMISPLVTMFPVGLGLKLLISVTLLVTLIYGLLVGIFSFFRYKNRWAVLFGIATIVVFLMANSQSGFSEERPKPNSLVYFFDSDAKEAYWATYDKIPDAWTDTYFNQPNDTVKALKTVFGSKYGTAFTKTQKTYIKPIKEPFIEVHNDTIINDLRYLSVYVSPQRLVNRYEVFAKEKYHFKSLKVNGTTFNTESLFTNDSYRICNYFVARDKYLEIEFSVPASEEVTLNFFEISYDLLDNDLYDVKPRSKDMIPKPFVVNDAVIIKKSWSSSNDPHENP